MEIPLNGTWQFGPARSYETTGPVPGLAFDPARIDAAPIWYRREVDLPAGEWTYATLELKGARFRPNVYVGGDLVSQAEGGMAPTVHRLDHPAVRPGERIDIEIALAPLSEVPAEDASCIPPADRWRSNVSACLWDDAVLRLHGPVALRRVVPFVDLADRTLTVHWQGDAVGPAPQRLKLEVDITDQAGRSVVRHRTDGVGLAGAAEVELDPSMGLWSPEEPTLYRLRVALAGDGKLLDETHQNLGLREFAVEGKGFRLNGLPITLRAGSVVWHRWCRDGESRRLAWDLGWLEHNIAARLKHHGANTLRFHLGTPPEAMLDLCDRLGLMVQIEWLFFHGLAASPQSLREQWRAWLDLCSRHPSVVLVHPWNETEGEELDKAFGVLAELAGEYPPMVVSHRDVIHVHKYWWSLFENVGVYYDSAEPFDGPIMVDEFGGNYLDGQCDPGGYNTLAESFLRFLGRNHTRQQRLELHTLANARVAEYWRRIGAAGFSPFCILGSWEDGNHHFLGPLAEGNPKPVWAALTAAYAPRSVSLDLWDRNYRPGQDVEWALQWFNETGEAAELTARVRIVAPGRPDEEWGGQDVRANVAAYGSARTLVRLRLPDAEGPWEVQAELTGGGCETVSHPPISAWPIQTFQPRVPAGLCGVRIGLTGEAPELRTFLTDMGFEPVAADDPDATVVLAGREVYEAIASGERNEVDVLEAALRRGTSVVMLDVGPRPLGQGYMDELGPLQGGRWIEEPEVVEVELLAGLRGRFREMPEPESCIHPPVGDEAIWWNLPGRATQLWNGLRGGLVVPAMDFEPVGMAPEAFLAAWSQRGADADAIRAGRQIAYDLAGFYAFSPEPDDAVAEALRQRVRFLVDDAPALAGAINPKAPIRTTDLAEAYRDSAHGQARTLETLAEAGKSLSRSPVVMVGFGERAGTLVLSQLLTKGRLAEGFGEDGPCGIRFDPAAVQTVVNLLTKAHDPAWRSREP